MDRWMDGWKEGQTDGLKFGCSLLKFVHSTNFRTASEKYTMIIVMEITKKS